MTRSTLVEMNVLSPVGLVVYGNFVYWIDKASRNVMKIKKNEWNRTVVQGAVNDLSDIAIVDTLKTTGRAGLHPFCYPCQT